MSETERDAMVQAILEYMGEWRTVYIGWEHHRYEITLSCEHHANPEVKWAEGLAARLPGGAPAPLGWVVVERRRDKTPRIVCEAHDKAGGFWCHRQVAEAQRAHYAAKFPIYLYTVEPVGARVPGTESAPDHEAEEYAAFHGLGDARVTESEVEPVASLGHRQEEDVSDKQMIENLQQWTEEEQREAAAIAFANAPTIEPWIEPDHVAEIHDLRALVTRLADAHEKLAAEYADAETYAGADGCYVAPFAQEVVDAARALVSEARRMTNKEGT